MELLPGTDGYIDVVDHALTTTRAVRMRLDLEKPVEDQVLLDCIDIAEQAPTGGNMGSRRWMIIRDQATKDRLAELYLAAGGSWVIETAERLDGTNHPNARMMQGAKRLAESIASMPALVIPTIIGRHDGSGRPGLFDSVIQSAWSFMVALLDARTWFGLDDDVPRSGRRGRRVARTARRRHPDLSLPGGLYQGRRLLAVETTASGPRHHLLRPFRPDQTLGR